MLQFGEATFRFVVLKARFCLAKIRTKKQLLIAVVKARDDALEVELTSVSLLKPIVMSQTLIFYDCGHFVAVLK